MSLYVNGVLQAGVNDIPSYTRAEYEALTEKPEYWICTDEDYEDLPSEYVTYGSGTVKDALDDLRGTEYKSNSIVNISAYNSNENCYVCPSEGYVRVGTSGDAMFMNNAGIIESAGNSVSVYVHKGAKVYGKNGSSNASSLRFIPLQ